MPGSTQTILVVEDEPTLCQVIKSKFERNGFKVFVADSVAKAKEAFHTNPIDALWLDHYLLGNGTGIELVSYIKKHDGKKDMPIFVVTNTAGSDMEKAYHQLGITNFYIKANHRLSDIIQGVKTYLLSMEDFEKPIGEANEKS